MRYALQTLILSLLLLLPARIFAQSPLSDIRPMLKSLTHEQKLQLLDYLRHLGADMDAEIQHTYEQLAKSQQSNAVKFLDALRQARKQEQLTTVHWNADTLLFSDTEAGDVITDSLRVVNTGYAPYRITSATTTCDCAVINLPQHPIMPGESATLRIRFDTHGKLGTATPAIILYDNSTPNKRHILYLKGNIVPRKKPRKYPWDD